MKTPLAVAPLVLAALAVSADGQTRSTPAPSPWPNVPKMSPADLRASHLATYKEVAAEIAGLRAERMTDDELGHALTALLAERERARALASLVDAKVRLENARKFAEAAEESPEERELSGLIDRLRRQADAQAEP